MVNSGILFGFEAYEILLCREDNEKTFFSGKVIVLVRLRPCRLIMRGSRVFNQTSRPRACWPKKEEFLEP
jgi:hypothetical protein